MIINQANDEWLHISTDIVGGRVRLKYRYEGVGAKFAIIKCASAKSITWWKKD